jgi:hypothetical protein
LSFPCFEVWADIVLDCRDSQRERRRSRLEGKNYNQLTTGWIQYNTAHSARSTRLNSNIFERRFLLLRSGRTTVQCHWHCHLLSYDVQLKELNQSYSSINDNRATNATLFAQRGFRFTRISVCTVLSESRFIVAKWIV